MVFNFFFYLLELETAQVTPYITTEYIKILSYFDTTNIKILLQLILVYLVIFNFQFFLSESGKSSKINSPNLYPVLNLSISFRSYYLKGTYCWEHNFLWNLFSQNTLWQFYPKTRNPIPQKFLIVNISSAKMPMVTMKI